MPHLRIGVDRPCQANRLCRILGLSCVILVAANADQVAVLVILRISSNFPLESGKVELIIRKLVDGPCGFCRNTGGEVEIRISNITSIFRTNHAHQIVVARLVCIQLTLLVSGSFCKGRSPCASAISLSINKAKAAGNLKAMVLDCLVDIDDIRCCQRAQVHAVVLHHVVQNRIQCASLLAYLGEVDIQRILAIVYCHRTNRFAVAGCTYLDERNTVLTLSKGSLGPLSEVLILAALCKVLGEVVRPLHVVQNVVLLFLREVIRVLKEVLQILSAAMLIRFDRESLFTGRLVFYAVVLNASLTLFNSPGLRSCRLGIAVVLFRIRDRLYDGVLQGLIILERCLRHFPLVGVRLKL